MARNLFTLASAGDDYDNDQTGDEGGDRLQNLLKLLEAKGIHLPPGVTEDSLIETLTTALHALKGSKEGVQLSLADVVDIQKRAARISPSHARNRKGDKGTVPDGNSIAARAARVSGKYPLPR